MTEDGVLNTEIDSNPADLPNDQASDEEMIPKSRAEMLIKKAKLKGRDQMQDELDAIKAENDQLKQNQNSGSMGGMAAPLSAEQVTKQVLAQLQDQFQQASEARAQEQLQKEAEDIAKAYKSKMDAGKNSYNDFESVMADFNPAAFPNLVYLVNQMDNTHDVMYELMNNPTKLATVVVMSERDPAAAKSMLGKISGSIKANQQAKASEKDVQPPLGRLSSSTTTGQDTGELSMRDLKRMFKG